MDGAKQAKNEINRIEAVDLLDISIEYDLINFDYQLTWSCNETGTWLRPPPPNVIGPLQLQSS